MRKVYWVQWFNTDTGEWNLSCLPNKRRAKKLGRARAGVFMMWTEVVGYAVA